ncbi:preprotein translocase subunit SecE [Parvularcula dongshanensis]|uniref:Protein translocase subunit SecE n=1 Tax=Parvularcula dongshanensis TaxID=1173995 RepID=A0A840I5R1_9PROT|nr:preprotein translocase subunit SecE [Parvularcula dongshanensis]MBB4660147.1 preprotein translocase subunit SecE [Parvularcula dongshanensis]
MPKSKNRRKTEQRAAAGRTARANVAAATGAQNPALGAVAPVPATEQPTRRTGRSESGARPRKKVGPVEFFSQVRAEARKITWTSRNETLISTLMVLVMVVIMSLFFFAVDQILRTVVPLILNISF